MVIRSSFVEQMAPVVTKKRQQPTSTTSFSTVVEQLLRRNAQSSASNETSTDERVQAIRAKLDSGKTLTPSELLYIRLNDPQQLSAIEQTMRERRMLIWLSYAHHQQFHKARCHANKRTRCKSI